jgi:hypothetical protein
MRHEELLEEEMITAPKIIARELAASGASHPFIRQHATRITPLTPMTVEEGRPNKGTVALLIGKRKRTYRFEGPIPV